MELTEKITLDMLTTDSVSVLRQQFLSYNGVLMQVGGNVRNAYSNSLSDRELLKNACIGLGVAAVSAGAAAVMNLQKEDTYNE